MVPALLRQIYSSYHFNFMKPLLIDTPFQEWNIKGLPSYRNKQIRKWIYEKGVLNFEEMSNLPLEVRRDLGNEWDLHAMELVRIQGSHDTTRKFLLKLRDGQLRM